jgi:hypothetical protein
MSRLTLALTRAFRFVFHVLKMSIQEKNKKMEKEEEEKR